MTVVAVVDNPVPSLCVELVQHGHGGELGPTQGGELPVPLPCHGQEGVTPVHQVTRYQVVWISGFGERGGDRGGRVQQHCEEGIFVLLDGLVDFGEDIVPSIPFLGTLYVSLGNLRGKGSEKGAEGREGKEV